MRYTQIISMYINVCTCACQYAWCECKFADKTISASLSKKEKVTFGQPRFRLCKTLIINNAKLKSKLITIALTPSSQSRHRSPNQIKGPLMLLNGWADYHQKVRRNESIRNVEFQVKNGRLSLGILDGLIMKIKNN